MSARNRPRRRAARRRRLRVGDVIWTRTIKNVHTGELYWFETTAPGEEPPALLPPPGIELHGPFKTDAAVEEDKRRVLFGPGCEVKEGGAWDPAWDRPQ
jgi:hypothetical protein